MQAHSRRCIRVPEACPRRGVLLRICRDNGKAHGSCYFGFRVWGLGLLTPNNGESNGKENGKRNGKRC